MKLKRWEYTAKYALIVLGVLTLVYSIVMAFAENLSSGIVLVALFALFLAALGVFFEKIFKIKWLLICIIAALSLLFVFMGFIAVYGQCDNADHTEDAVIVLGCGIDGDKVSPQLARRLDRAVEYCKKNPGAVVVVSGGKGPQENVSEASAMEKYLVERGIPADRILKEEKSVSTYTNLVNSKEILDNYFEKDYKVTVITSSYHIYRADMIAKKAGLDCTRVHADTPLYSMPVRYFRECAGVIHLWLFGE